VGERARRGRVLGEAAVAVVGDRGAEIAIVVECDERADGLRIGNALGHAAMIPARTGASPTVHSTGPPLRQGRPLDP
jgi:hypothetical protein